MPDRRRKYTKREKATAVMAAAVSTVSAAAEQTGIPESTLRYWVDAPEFVELRAKTREEMAEGFHVLAQLAQKRLRELLPQMEPRDLVTLMGVSTDKAQLLAGHATTRTETREVDPVESLDDHEKEALRRAVEQELANADAR